MPQEIDISVTIRFTSESRYMGDPAKLLSKTELIVTFANLKLTTVEGLDPCILQSVEGVGTVTHSLTSHCGSGAPNYAARTGGVGQTTQCEVSQCYSACKAVYPCTTETITTSHPAEAYSLTLDCFDPCRMETPGANYALCNPEGYPHITWQTSGAPSTVAKVWHCPWNLNANCPACTASLCCCPPESYETDSLVGFGGQFWGKKGCIDYDTFSADNLFGGGSDGFGYLPVPSTCPDNGVDPVVPIPWTQAPPNGLYNPYSCTPGSCAFGSQAQPTTIPNRPASYITATECVICQTPNIAPDVHACWEYTLVNGAVRYANMQKCNCYDPPAFDLPTGFSSISANCPDGPGVNGGAPGWPQANPGDPCEPIACPNTEGCGCIEYWYEQSYQVTIHNIVP